MTRRQTWFSAPGLFSGWFLLAALAAPLGGCKAKVPEITAPFRDDFERAEPGPNWLDTSGQVRLEAGKLHVSQGYNRPVWLRQKLPRDLVVELDVASKSPDGDIKVELFGDGQSFDLDRGSYEATGYVFIFGGWQNTLSIIGRLGEHDDAVKVKRSEPAVVPGKTYHWKITRKGGQIDWQIDGQPFLSWTDPEPLAGDGRAFLGITNWQADVDYDNVQIRPL